MMAQITSAQDPHTRRTEAWLLDRWNRAKPAINRHRLIVCRSDVGFGSWPCENASAMQPRGALEDGEGPRTLTVDIDAGARPPAWTHCRWQRTQDASHKASFPAMVGIRVCVDYSLPTAD